MAHKNLKGGISEMLFLPREEGQGLVEYALILVLVAIVVIVVLTFLGEQVTNVFQNIADALS
jgi:pilus assembly protein Flp/PilA